MPFPAFNRADFSAALQRLLPTGAVWPRDPDTTQARTLAALAPTYERSQGAANQLATDAFPGTTENLLPEWEESVGLPDPCTGPLPTIEQRRAQVVARVSAGGSLSAPYFTAFAAALGYTITIQTYTPFRLGRRGDLIFGGKLGDKLGPVSWAHRWTVHAPATTSIPFRLSESGLGDPFVATGNAVLECELTRIKPAETNIDFSYP